MSTKKPIASSAKKPIAKRKRRRIGEIPTSHKPKKVARSADEVWASISLDVLKLTLNIQEA